ncbi:MAG TPA: hypothetical protein VHQ22_08225 [Terriglobales bacterium]|nr:hypothetical protein [Terriglobales bacterium]
MPFRTSAAATYRKTHNSTLFAILVHLHDAINYVLYGLNTDTPARLDAIYNSTLQTMVSGQERKQRKPS